MTAISQTPNKTKTVLSVKYVKCLQGCSLTVYGFERFMPKFKE